MHCATASDVDVNLMMIEKNMNYYVVWLLFSSFCTMLCVSFTHTIKSRYRKRRFKTFKFN